jgi:hypothetical protein
VSGMTRERASFFMCLTYETATGWEPSHAKDLTAERDSDIPHFDNILEMAEWIASEGRKKKLEKQPKYSKLLTYLAGGEYGSREESVKKGK